MNKKTIFWLVLTIILLLVIVGCTTQSGAPPVGPVGGGC